MAVGGRRKIRAGTWLTTTGQGIVSRHALRVPLDKSNP